LLKELLVSHDESYILEVDVEEMIGVKKKKYSFHKRKWKDIVFVDSISRIKKVLSKESCHGVGVVMCCSLNSC
jgi:hypothetical protein